MELALQAGLLDHTRWETVPGKYEHSAFSRFQSGVHCEVLVFRNLGIYEQSQTKHNPFQIKGINIIGSLKCSALLPDIIKGTEAAEAQSLSAPFHPQSWQVRTASHQSVRNNSHHTAHNCRAALQTWYYPQTSQIQLSTQVLQNGPSMDIYWYFRNRENI